MVKREREYTDPRAWAVIGYYQEGGQIVADEVEARTGAQAIRKAGKSDMREGCRFIVAVPKGTPLSFPEGE